MDPDEDEKDEEGGGNSAELFASYWKFGRRAVSRRKILVLAIFAVSTALVVTVVSLWPRTYHCETRLMAVRNQVLSTRADAWNDALAGAADVVLRRDNLEAIVKQTNLLKDYFEKRPFVLRVKDSVMESLRGSVSDEDRMSGLVWTLESKLLVEGSDVSLKIAVDWPEARSAAAIVQAAQQNFLEARHSAEISTFTEYISILEGHATTLRGEIHTFADQIRKLREEKIAAVEQKASAGAGKEEGEPRPRRRAPRPLGPDQDVLKVKQDLEGKQREIQELEAFRSRRVVELQAKLAELRTKYTAAHPALVDAQQSLASVSQESARTTALRGEAQELEAEIRRRGSAVDLPVPGMGGAPGPAEGAAGPLPSDIMSLMQESDEALDPAVAAQFRYAVAQYSTLRSQISTARIDLDTAQAAFKHRYKVVVPPEVPNKPVKPKVPLLIAIGVVLSLLLALGSAVAFELSTGRIVEKWQVHQIALPVLAELQFPPRSSDS